LGVEIRVEVSGILESAEGSPESIAVGNAELKCRSVAQRLEGEALVIGADTIVALGDTVFGKPCDQEEARAMLTSLSGNTHEVVTGIACVRVSDGAFCRGSETTRVTFRELDPGEIESFIEAVNPVDRAGAYTVDGPGSLLVARYDGCYQNVLGLPIVRLEALLRELDDGLYPRMRPDRVRFL
jgi:septum formation protein